MAMGIKTIPFYGYHVSSSGVSYNTTTSSGASVFWGPGTPYTTTHSVISRKENPTDILMRKLKSDILDE